MAQHDQVNHHHQSNRPPDPKADSSPASWPSLPTEPDSMPPSMAVQGSLQGPRPEPLRRYSPDRDWHRQRDQERAEQERLRQQERSEQQRREYLWRKQLDLRLERQRLDTEEQALQQAWDTLPQPTSRLVRLIIGLAILVTIIALVAFYPVLLIPLVLILLIVGRFRRRRSFSPRPSDTQWTERERFRIQSRIAWIDARVASITQEEQAISSELLALPTQHNPQP